VLAAASNGAGQQPSVGGENLYVEEPNPSVPGQQRLAYIAKLSYSDSGDWAPNPGRRVAEATPSGEQLLFTSVENLTGGSYSGEGVQEEVYVWDSSDASLFCASCRPQASGGSVPQADGVTDLPRWISEDGDQVFFDSSAPLVSRDVNGVEDVYEWERDGSGECREASGCVYLISDGREGPAHLIGASANGNDVFMVTRQRLSPTDGNENVDLYDARVDGVLPVSPPVCSGTACQGLPTPPPVFATPASVTFDGVGNFAPTTTTKTGVVKTKKAKSLTRAQKLSRALKSCHKQRTEGRRATCERRAHRQYGTETKGKHARLTGSSKRGSK
jgi:hypothetical protein